MDKLNAGNNKHGYCPFSFQTIMVPHEIPAGIIQGSKQGGVSVQVQNVAVPCVAEQCQLWDKKAGMCSMKSIAGTLKILTDKIADKNGG